MKNKNETTCTSMRVLYIHFRNGFKTHEISIEISPIMSFQNSENCSQSLHSDAAVQSYVKLWN